MRRTFWQWLTRQKPIEAEPPHKPFRVYMRGIFPPAMEFDVSVDRGLLCCDDCGGLDSNRVWCRAFARFLKGGQLRCAACLARFERPENPCGEIDVRVTGEGGTLEYADWFDDLCEEQRKGQIVDPERIANSMLAKYEKITHEAFVSAYAEDKDDD